MIDFRHPSWSLALLLASPALSGAAPQSRTPVAQASSFELVSLDNGFGQLVPHAVLRLDAERRPTAERLEIRSLQDLTANVSIDNPVLPVEPWPLRARLGDGAAGNHYIALTLSAPIDLDSALQGGVQVLALDPVAGTSSPVSGRAFVGGWTRPARGASPQEPQQWFFERAGRLVANPAIDADADGTPDGLGVPGTQDAELAAAQRLASACTFLFVADTDGDLGTHETFPVGHQIVLRATHALRSQTGVGLAQEVLGSATVGADRLAPTLLGETVPALGAVDVDPRTTLALRFSEPVQPLSLGALPGTGQPDQAALQLHFGPPEASTAMPFTLLPASPFDLSHWILTPALAFPGRSPQDASGFNHVALQLAPERLSDLAANAAAHGLDSSFETGVGPALVNAPVLPDAVYVTRGGATPAVSVIDLNGFGQSTGDPSFDFTYTTFQEGRSNFPNNPNVIFMGGLMYPPLFPGTTTFDGGSSGVFTLTRDSNLDDRLLRAPDVASVGAMLVGHPLDTVYHNGKDPGGCQAGGGNLCAITGLKIVDALFGTPLAATFAVPANIPGTSGYGGAAFVPGGGNPISWAPHPNPPALIQPALCQVPLIEGQEPTGYVTAAPLAAGGLGLVNLLVPGDAQGDPSNGVPPTGLLAQQQNTWFEGPDKASQPLGACTTYMQRQQIGHFLYMVDRAAQQIVVLNSNRMTVLARIAVPDPVELAIGPNLDYLAVTSASTDSVWFIGVDPAAPGFHTVLKTVAVGRSPRGIAWDPGNEDILVCNQGDDSLSVIAVFSLEVRKTVTGFLDRPFDVVITQRQYLFGTERYVYFGWILNRSGELTLFESGPSGVDGWGYDSTIGVAGMVFAQPRRLIADPQQLSGGVWVAHEGPLDDLGQPTGVAGGAVTRARIVSSQFGPQKLTPHDFWKPQLRDMRVRVEASLDESVLTGVPVDLALDDQVNLGVTRNLVSPFSVGLPLPINGKSLVRGSNGGVVPAKSPQFLLVAVPSSSEGPGVVDVIELGSLLRRDTNAWQPGVQSIPAAGVTGLCDYWRQ